MTINSIPKGSLWYDKVKKIFKYILMSNKELVNMFSPHLIRIHAYYEYFLKIGKDQKAWLLSARVANGLWIDVIMKHAEKLIVNKFWKMVEKGIVLIELKFFI